VGIIDRIILTVYTMALLVCSGLAVLIGLGWARPAGAIRVALDTLNGRLSIGAVGLIFFVSSVRLLILAFRRRQPGQSVVHETDLGDVNISLDAIENLVQRVARQMRGVRDVRPQVGLSADGLHASMRVWVSPDVNIPELARDLQEEVGRSVQGVVGVALAGLDIRVENITTETRRGRVD
jgi:uncharacterized alkaline shock family protein YloU